MNLNRRIFSTTVSALLFVLFVFMNFVGIWTADPTIQILFFFIMVAAIFNAGIEIGKNRKDRD